MNIELQKKHPLFQTSELKSLDDTLALLRTQKAYQFAADFCKNKTVVEIGCNTGFCTPILAKAANKVFALDLNEPALNYASSNHSANNLEYMLVDGESFPELSPPPEVAVFFQLIEHISDDRHFLNRVQNLLHRGGKIIMTTPNARHRLKKGQKPWNPYHVREYLLSDLKSLLDPLFKSYEILGVFGTKEVQALELKRTRQSFFRRHVIDPYQRLTGHFSIRAKIRKTFGLTSSKTTKLYGEDSFYISNKNLEDALDFLVVISL